MRYLFKSLLKLCRIHEEAERVSAMKTEDDIIFQFLNSITGIDIARKIRDIHIAAYAVSILHEEITAAQQMCV